MSSLSEVKEYWFNGQLQWHTFYRNGKREGESKAWYENGYIYWREFYRNGKLDSESKGWYKNGQYRWNIFYKNNEHEGEQKWWDENGKIEFYRYWINDIILDANFSLRKKYILLKLKRNILNKTYKHKYKPFLNDKLISDLANIIIRYM